MSFGKYMYFDNGFLLNLYGNIIGVFDFHSHIRWNAIRSLLNYSSKNTLEVGSGAGLMTFEFAKRAKKTNIIASEYNTQQANRGELIANIFSFDNVDFITADLRSLSIDKKFDQVLAVDVLEHIDDDEKALKQINGVMDVNGKFVFSLPSVNYPKVFGQAFADEIGHVRDGYTFDTITKKLEKSGFKIDLIYSHTQKFSSNLCSIFYQSKIFNKFKILKLLSMPLFLPLALLTEKKRHKELSSAGIAGVCTKVKDI